ncbi:MULTISPECIES: ABC transporter permease [unclassified Acidisoma]|jgi:peptide/nickel transport system permease protein|uniref:ABC transporter permease n=1 Tax=unclassified Acidisoma TaxID=2634065 RepID=UPI00131B75F7|nr:MULTISPECIES: ABC transporter permease [unclassified Acidisoma]
MRFAQALAYRLLLAVITLVLLSIIVFAGCQVLPGDVGRAILGPLADARAVAVLNHQLGVDQPLLLQYWHWVSGMVQGNMGMSYTYRAPVGPFIGHALVNSLKLAGVAFVFVVPLGILGGVVAALRLGTWIDRAIVLSGLSATVVPEFVSGIVLIMVFSIWLHVFPLTATAPNSAGGLTQLYYLLMPAIPLFMIIFGYIARMARAGMVEALASDYTRTAVLKGLTYRQVIWRHVLRNALLPTITVVAVQSGYLIGGLVVVETLFNYHGIGGLIFAAAKAKDFPMLAAGILVIGLTYIVANLVADMLYSALNPRISFGRRE